MRADSDMGPPGERGGWLQRKFVRYPWHFGVGLLLLVITGTRPFMRQNPADPAPVSTSSASPRVARLHQPRDVFRRGLLSHAQVRSR